MFRQTHETLVRARTQLYRARAIAELDAPAVVLPLSEALEHVNRALDLIQENGDQ